MYLGDVAMQLVKVLSVYCGDEFAADRPPVLSVYSIEGSAPTRVPGGFAFGFPGKEATRADTPKGFEIY